MSRESTTYLTFVVAAISIGAIVILVSEMREMRGAPQVGEFQQIVGGLGVGPDANMSACQFSFDPRVSPDWRGAHVPIVCGEYFCPRHGASVFYLSPVESNATALTPSRK